MIIWGLNEYDIGANLRMSLKVDSILIEEMVVTV